MENQVSNAQSVILTVGETLFVKSLIRALNNRGDIRVVVAKESNMTEDNLNHELDALSKKLDIMTFPVKE